MSYLVIVKLYPQANVTFFYCASLLNLSSNTSVLMRRREGKG